MDYNLDNNFQYIELQNDPMIVLCILSLGFSKAMGQ